MTGQTTWPIKTTLNYSYLTVNDKANPRVINILYGAFLKHDEISEIRLLRNWVDDKYVS